MSDATAGGGPDYSYERARRKAGARFVAGVDEVGRGPLAGPVAVAAVILDPKRIPKGLDDSKALTAERREELTVQIFATALAVSIALGSAEEIDLYNIRGATLRAMRRAVSALAPRPDFVLIDGRDIPEGLPCPAQAIIGGDGLSQSIAAASIVAKTLRDSLMAGCDADPSRLRLCQPCRLRDQGASRSDHAARPMPPTPALVPAQPRCLSGA